MEFFKNIKKNIDLIRNKINEIKQKIDSFKQAAKDSIFTKIAYWFFMICVWWPVKYSFLFLYYLGIWPFIKLFGGGSSSNINLSSSSSSSSIDFDELDAKSSNKKWKIQVYQGSYWEDRATGDDPNPNYISSRVETIKKQNGNKKTRAIYMDSGQVIDIS